MWSLVSLLRQGTLVSVRDASRLHRGPNSRSREAEAERATENASDQLEQVG
uniref:Uncharacterized protein n=1 Tax=Ascaris lumbricoides TaxID=6252 RepID=A0A0M3HQT9_ASCLU